MDSGLTSSWRKRPDILAVGSVSLAMVCRRFIVTTLFPARLQHLEIERLIGDHPLELPILLIQRAQALGLAGLHPAVLLPPPVERLARDPVIGGSPSPLFPVRSASCRIATICSSLNRLFHLPVSSPPRGIGDCQLANGPRNWVTRHREPERYRCAHRRRVRGLLRGDHCGRCRWPPSADVGRYARTTRHRRRSGSVRRDHPCANARMGVAAREVPLGRVILITTLGTIGGAMAGELGALSQLLRPDHPERDRGRLRGLAAFRNRPADPRPAQIG